MYAVIDLGSNSFHLLIAELKQHQLRVVGRCSEKIQLAEGINKSGELSVAAMERGLRCLAQFQSILAQHPIEKLKVVGTEAIRRATNRDVFISNALSLGFHIDVISGQQEARWIYAGICGPLPNCDKRRLTIDIGGASTEIAVGKDDDIEFTESIAVGCVSWRDQFFSPTFNFAANRPAAYATTTKAFAPVVAQLKKLQWEEVYASSGSAKMLATIGYANNWSEGNITRACVSKVEAYLSTVQHLEDIKLPGLKEQRLDLLAPGLVIMASLMDALTINEIYYSPTSLREGILAELIQRRVD